MLRRVATGVAGLATFCVVSVLVMHLSLALRFSNGWEWVYAIAQPCIPLAASVWVARRVAGQARTSAGTSINRPRLLWLGVAMAYVVTGVAGGPAVQSAQAAWAMGEFARVHHQPSDPEGKLPRMDVYLTFPLLPGVLVSYYQYTIADLYGLEAWGVFAWHGGDATKLLELPLSVS